MMYAPGLHHVLGDQVDDRCSSICFLFKEKNGIKSTR